jgi:tetratricopeptide (TPR) repeat protein
VALRFDDARAALAWLNAERRNLSAAIRSAAERGRAEHVWRFAVLLWRWHYLRDQLEDWTEALELARQILDVPDGDQDSLATVLLRLSNARWMARQPDMALELAARALSIWRKLGDAAGEASAYAAIAMVDIRRGKHDSAVAHFSAALGLFTEAGDDAGRGNALSNLGYLYQVRGDLDDAERSHSEAAVLLEAVDEVLGLAHTLENRGYVRELLGRLDDAERDHERARELAATLGNVSVQARAVNGLGNVARRRGRPREALALHERARALADQINEPALRTQLYVDRGETYLALGDYSAARTAYLAALDLGEGCGEHDLRAEAVLGAARAFHRARACGEESTRYWRMAGDAFDELRLPAADEVRAEYEQLTCACRVAQ